MTQLAATATAQHDPTGGYLLIACVLLAWALGYGLACYVWPFRACPRCTGSGKRRSPSGRAWRRCRRCKGSGERLRIGRRVWNYARRLRAEDNR